MRLRAFHGAKNACALLKTNNDETIPDSRPVKANEKMSRVSYQTGKLSVGFRCKRSVMIYGALGKKSNHRKR